MPQDTPFSFHCMICFEEFHPDERYPVVLPCGHTYVCNVCANRLDKCMECRIPLYTKVQTKAGEVVGVTPAAGPSTTPVRASWSASNRARVLNGTSSPEAPQPVVKKRLPLPKNVVLLSLIEATELATQDVHKKPSESLLETVDEVESVGSMDRRSVIDAAGRPGVYSMNSMVDIEDDEEEKIKVGTTLALGVAGTYAVAVKEGMEIYAKRPGKVDMDTSLTHSTEDVDSLVKMYPAHGDGYAEPDGTEHQKNGQLSYGDRVQVVALEGGWAKLARGYGYVRADGNRLVKVGGSVDRACKLEAMLRNLSIKRKELRKEQSRVDNQFVRLMNDLQLSLQKDEDLTVIAADTFAGTDDLLPMPVEAEKKEEHEAARHSSQRENEENNDDDWRITKPSRLEITPQQVQRQSRPNLMCFAGEVFTGYSSELPDERREAMSPRSLGNTSPFSDNLPSLFPSASHPSPSALRAGAQAWRERHGQSPRSGIDFRTGMSGHMALLSTHAHPHEFLEPSTSYSTSSSLTIPRMSSHTGLTMSRNKAFSILSSLTLPTFGSSANTEERREDTVQQSGSM